MKICDLININELSVNFDLQEKYFLHIHCWEPPQIRRVSTGLTGLLWYGVVLTIQFTVSFVFLAAIFHVTIHFKLNFMFLGIICLNTVCST